jgi:Zn-dependent protease with chaperone function
VTDETTRRGAESGAGPAPGQERAHDCDRTRTRRSRPLARDTVRVDDLPVAAVGDVVSRAAERALGADVTERTPGRNGTAGRRTVRRLDAVAPGRPRITYEWEVVAAADRGTVLVHERRFGPWSYPYGLGVAAAALGVVCSLVALVSGAGQPGAGGLDGVAVPVGLVVGCGLCVLVGLGWDLACTTSAGGVLARPGVDVGRLEASAAGHVPAYLALGGWCAVAVGGGVAGVPFATVGGVVGLYALAVGWLVAGDRALALAVRVGVDRRIPTPVGEYLLAVGGAAVPSAGLLVGRAFLPAGTAGPVLIAAAGVGVVTAASVVVGPAGDVDAARELFGAGVRAGGGPRTRYGLALVATVLAYASLRVAAAGWTVGGVPGGWPPGLATAARVAVLAPYGVLVVGMLVGAVAAGLDHRRRVREAVPATCPAADAVDVPVYVTDGDPLDVVGYDDGRRRRVFLPRATIELLGPDDDRLRAVIAHEAAHVRHGDALRSVWAPVLAPPLGLGGNVLLAALDFRRRERRADRAAAAAVSPAAVIGALEALAAAADRRRLSRAGWTSTPFLPRATVTPDGRTDEADVGDDGSEAGREDASPGVWDRLIGPGDAFALFFGGFAVSRAHPTVAERTAALGGPDGDRAEADARRG